MLCLVKKGVAKLVPQSSHHKKCNLVTLEHMRCLLQCLNLSNAKDAAIYSASIAAFHGICRYTGAECAIFDILPLQIFLDPVNYVF